MGETVFRALMNALIGSLVVGLMIGLPPQPIGILVALPAILGAWVLNFCISVLIGLSAFVVEDISAFQWIFQKLSFILGGLLIPLDFYPGWLQSIARSLPFSAMVYGPSRLFATPSLDLFLSTLGMQLVWMLALGFISVLAYRRGVAVLTVNGG